MLPLLGQCALHTIADTVRERADRADSLWRETGDLAIFLGVASVAIQDDPSDSILCGTREATNRAYHHCCALAEKEGQRKPSRQESVIPTCSHRQQRSCPDTCYLLLACEQGRWNCKMLRFTQGEEALCLADGGLGSALRQCVIGQRGCVRAAHALTSDFTTVVFILEFFTSRWTHR